MVPSAFGSNMLQVAIRGQRQYDPYITKDPAVAVYFAEVVQNRPQGINSGLFDLESVQVLKGPQGTLFGRNTTGGAVLISPVTPTDEFEGYRSEEHTSELQSLMRISYAVFCLKKKNKKKISYHK